MVKVKAKASRVRFIADDMRKVLPAYPENHFHSCVTDPPYELGFMGKSWDQRGIAFDPATWAEVLRVLRPGAHLLAFGGSRTSHRMACAIEDAGFEIRDTLLWLYGSGFPKSLDVSKAIDKAAGAEREVVGSKIGQPGYSLAPDKGRGTYSPDGRSSEVECVITAPSTEAAKQWDGWGSALKPAFEPIILARKPLDGTIAANVLKWGCGALNIGVSRVGTETVTTRAKGQEQSLAGTSGRDTSGSHKWNGCDESSRQGRYPANVLHDGSPEVVGMFPETTSGKAAKGGHKRTSENMEKGSDIYGGGKGIAGTSSTDDAGTLYGDSGSAARFFYTAKANSSERPVHVKDCGGKVLHPTVKPLALIEYLTKMVTPLDGICLDPFVGSGTLLEACRHLGFRAVGIDDHAEYPALVEVRMSREYPRKAKVLRG